MKTLWWCLLLLFSYGYASGDVVSEVLVKSTKSWDDTVLPAYPKEAPELTLMKITIPPHTTLPMHKHPIINVGYMLKGAWKVVTKENKTLALKAGDAIIEVVDTWHYGMNEGDEPVEIIVFYAGVKESAYAIKP